MKVTFVEIATATPMGQQAYERAIQDAVAQAAGPDVQLARLRVSSLRNEVEADRRVPWGVLERLPAPAARLVGAWTYRGTGLVHRLDLRLPPSAGPEVVTVHDLPGLRFPDEGAVPRALAAGARGAAAVIVPSSFARDEVVELLGVDASRVHVIPYGLSASYSHPPEQPASPGLAGLGGRFVLHAAGATQRKNLAGLAAAWKELAEEVPDVQLLLCGPEDARRSTAFSGLPRVRLLGRLPPGDVAWLMRRASAVVVPSTYEGFGLPALEGMAAGTPVVAARTGALPEVCEQAALLVEPSGPGLAEGLRQVLGDPDLEARLRLRGPGRAAAFDWERAALAHLAVYRSVA